MQSKRIAGLLVVVSAVLAIANPTPGSAANPVDIIFASDFLSGSALQWVRRHPQAGGASIALAPARVSAVKLSNGDADMMLYLQVPPALNHETGYPAFSALKTFGPSNPSSPVIGDCVIARGTITLDHGATELSPATITAAADNDCGGSPLTAYLTTVADVATITADNQPGPLAESLESVLITLNPVNVLGTPEPESFRVVDPGGAFNPPALYVIPILYAFSPNPGAHLQITGVYDEADHTAPAMIWYQLLPRGASDIVVLP